ncbi:hypothetical protein [Avibacterium avium]|uniref:hypothetical protein n=1 Tax=Avibacterium avium TaxID=751 RepID=UPI003BF8A429
MYFLTSNKFKEFPPHFKFALTEFPRPNRPNGNKIFRKITPSESEANIRLIFREENFIGMRKSGLIEVPFSLLPFFWVSKRKEVANGETRYQSQRKKRFSTNKAYHT